MQLKHIFIALFCCLLWGGNFVAAKVALGTFPPFYYVALRMLLAAAIILPFAKRPKTPILMLFWIAVSYAVVNVALMSMAMRYGLTASLAALLDQLRVPFAVILAAILFKDHFRWRTALGILGAFLGTFIIVRTPDANVPLIAIVLALLSSWGWAFYNCFLKMINEDNFTGLIGYLSLLGAIPLLIISLFFEKNHIQLLAIAPFEAYLGLIYATIGSSIMAHGLWYYLLNKCPVNEVVPFTLLVPVFGVFLGAMILGDVIDYYTILGGIIILLGVGIIVIRRPFSIKTAEDN